MQSAEDPRRRDWEELDVTRDELDTIAECMKQPEFRQLLCDYAAEVQDPENRRRYEQELQELERQRGYDLVFVHPEPGYVIKTSLDGYTKCFVNVAANERVERPASRHQVDPEGGHGLTWTIPHTLTAPRDDLDNKNARCRVFDVVFHPDALYLSSRNERFKKLLDDTAIDSVQKNFKVKLDRNNLKFPNLKYKGLSQAAVIRKPCEKPAEKIVMDPEIYQKIMSSYDEQRKKHTDLPVKEAITKPAPKSKHNRKTVPNKSVPTVKPEYTIPHYIVKHQSNIDMEEYTNDRDAKLNCAIPKNLVVEIDLPLLKSANNAVLDVHEQHLSLKSEKPAKYHLELPLSHRVDADNGLAKFDVKSKKLVVTLPVIRGTSINIDHKEDSGVESDHGSPVPEKTDDSLEDSLDNSPMWVVNENDKVQSDSEDNEFRTDYELNEPFMNPNIKYTLPSFTANLYDNVLAITIHTKNVDNDSISHRLLENNSGVHIILTTVGAGFFPVYLSLCLKVKDNFVIPETLSIEPWDNNVVVTINVSNPEDYSKYLVGLDENLMEPKDFIGVVTITNKLQELMEESQLETDRNVEVIKKQDEVIVNVRSRHNTTDDEYEQDSEYSQDEYKKSRLVSESSGDELPNSHSDGRQYNGILKNKRNHYSRSISESSVDENHFPSSSLESHNQSSYRFKGILKSKPIQYARSVSDSSIDDHGIRFSSLQNDYVPDPEFSGVKKTVRFNSVVSRQLYRSNSSILGQRKKNQRKMRNKKRSQERRMSESEASETEEQHKFKQDLKNSSHESRTVRPILRQNKGNDSNKTASIDIFSTKRGSKELMSNESSKHENAPRNEQMNNLECEKNGGGPEFKSELLFELDM